MNDKIAAYDEIYSKYSESLDMDYHHRNDPPVKQPDNDVTATLYDCYDENGKELTRLESEASYEEIENIIKKYKGD